MDALAGTWRLLYSSAFARARRGAGAHGHSQFQMGEFLPPGQRAHKAFGLPRQILERADHRFKPPQQI